MRTKRLLGGLSAGVLLMVLLVGVPLLLIVGLGNPLPDWNALRTGDLSDQALVQLLGCVLWIAWAQWVPGTLLEMAAGVRDTHAQRSTHPGYAAREPRHISAGQGLSRALVSAIVGLAISAPIIVNASRAWAVPTPADGPAPTRAVAIARTDTPTVHADGPPQSRGIGTKSATHGAPAPVTTHPIFVVGSNPAIGPSLWSIAQHTMGDPMRWRDIWALNKDRPMSDGTVFTDADDIHNGWQLRLPADATVPGIESIAPGTEVTVQRGDTVDAIARGELHVDPQRLIDANLGRGEPGGRVFNDPNLILPGWKLRAPAAPTTASPHGAPTSHTLRRVRPRQPTSPTPAAPPSQPAQPTPSAPSRTAEPAHNVHNGKAPAGAPHSSSELPMVAFVGGGVLLAGASLSALLAYRRRQFRLRRPGNTISAAPPELFHAERTLLSTGGPAVLDVAWLDQVLRGLVHGMDDGSDPAALAARLPDVVAARLAREELELVLSSAQPDAPAPWRVDETGRRWSISRGENCDYDPSRRAYHFAPFPTLTSVGYDGDGSQWLLDLERVASMSLTGDPERCLDLARFVACELAHNTWSEMLRVTLVGFGQEIVEANPDRLSHTEDFDAAVAELSEQVDSVTDALHHGGMGVLAARTGARFGDAWAPHVLMIAPDAARDRDGLDRLLLTMRQQRSRMAVAVVLSDGADHADATTWKMLVDADGTLHIPGLGLVLTAQQMPAEEAVEIARLLAFAATTTDAPMPHSSGQNPWDRFADAAGQLRISADEPIGRNVQVPVDDQDSQGAVDAEPVDGRETTSGAAGSSRVDRTEDGSVHATDVPTPHLADAAAPSNSSVLPLARAAYLERAATTAEDLVTLAPQTSDAIREEVESAVGDLDADLAEWYDEASVRPRVSLLGPVRVRAQGFLPERNPRTQWHTEIVAYLVTRPSGVSSEEYGTALWPNDPDINGKSKVRQSVMIVRKWLGKNPSTGVEYLPPAMAPGFARYRIDGALVDAELFRRLRLRGIARGAEGIEDLWAALHLVTGEPFSERRKEGYAWLADMPLHHIYAAMIVDVAHTVATHHLGAGEPDRASEAAQSALDASSTEDVPLLDKVAACDAQDLRAEADAFVKSILTNHDAEIEEDLPPRTAEVLMRRQWIGNAS